MGYPSQEILRELLHYDPDTGIFTWMERGRRWFSTDGSHKSWNSSMAGKRAGRVHSHTVTGYQCRRIKLQGKVYLEHRLAWIYMNGGQLPDQIDHINRDATDNRWKNMIASNNSENGMNQSINSSNTSGVTGVSWDKRAKKWRASCKVDGKQNHIGYFGNIEEARDALVFFRSLHGFNPKHGLEFSHYRKNKLTYRGE